MLDMNAVQRHWDPALRKAANLIKSAEQARGSREKLNAYLKQLPHKHQWMVSHTIAHIKNKFWLDNPGKSNHLLSDHGFCRSLERIYGVNVDKLKDMVVNDMLNNREYRFVGNEEKIFTVLKGVK